MNPLETYLKEMRDIRSTEPGVRDANKVATWGRRAFIGITDPWDAKQIIRSALTLQGEIERAHGQ